MKLINGHKIADKILKSVKSNIKNARLKPHLAVILIGSDPASHLYVSLKEQATKQVNINFKKYIFPVKTSQSKVINLINKLNKNKQITAIIVQLPLPKHLNTDKIISVIDPKKDADGIHPDNTLVLPATTGAILEALKYTKVNLNHKSIAIIGKSKIVGLPTYNYLKNKCANIAIYDSSTKNLSSKTSKADILIIAIGSPQFITNKYIKKNTIIIDVGINRIKNKTIGDVDRQSIKNKTQYLTPVPGGIGPITIAILLRNTYQLWKKQINQSN